MSVIHTSPSLNNPSRAADWCNHWIKRGDATLNGRFPMICSGPEASSFGSNGARACNDDDTSSAFPWMICGWWWWCVKKWGGGSFIHVNNTYSEPSSGCFGQLLYLEREREPCQQSLSFIHATVCQPTVNVGKNRSSFSIAAIRLTPVSKIDLVSNPGPKW